MFFLTVTLDEKRTSHPNVYFILRIPDRLPELKAGGNVPSQENAVPLENFPPKVTSDNVVETDNTP